MSEEKAVPQAQPSQFGGPFGHLLFAKELVDVGVEENAARLIQQALCKKADHEFVKKLAESLSNTVKTQSETADVIHKHYSHILDVMTDQLEKKNKEHEEVKAELKEVCALAEAVKPDYHKTQVEMAGLREKLNQTVTFFRILLGATVLAMLYGPFEWLKGLLTSTSP